jgi:hypothetical protein
MHTAGVTDVKPRTMVGSMASVAIIGSLRRSTLPVCNAWPVITTEVHSSASASTIHELLVDVDAWSVWSPHVASVEATTRRVEPGWVGSTRAFFSPAATSMVVDDVRADGGYTWHSSIGPWRLDYDNSIVAADHGTIVRFSAALGGPAGPLLERIVAPLSRAGQRRRMARLVRLAELIEHQTR